jgi:hypothetical protein
MKEDMKQKWQVFPDNIIARIRKTVRSVILIGELLMA